MFLTNWPGGGPGHCSQITPHLPVTARFCLLVDIEDFNDDNFRRGSLQLWQFLIALLEDPSNCAAITWTGRGMEFKLIEPEEVGIDHSFDKTSLILL